MLHAGLDLSRKRLDVHLLDERGETVAPTAAPPDAGGLAPRRRRPRRPTPAAWPASSGASTGTASRCGRRSSR